MLLEVDTNNTVYLIGTIEYITSCSVCVSYTRIGPRAKYAMKVGTIKREHWSLEAHVVKWTFRFPRLKGKHLEYVDIVRFPREADAVEPEQHEQDQS